ncbi:hypothetical protein ACFTSF_03070 [Kribbella sp. NPDC056951]|uniref:hypothetical protein n=1 Tax=Kribbella sp. NPDC056951 TaxID=3345978 RepID=UPI00362FA4A6
MTAPGEEDPKTAPEAVTQELPPVPADPKPPADAPKGTPKGRADGKAEGNPAEKAAEDKAAGGEAEDKPGEKAAEDKAAGGQAEGQANDAPAEKAAEGATTPPSAPPAPPKKRLWGRGERRRSGRGSNAEGKPEDNAAGKPADKAGDNAERKPGDKAGEKVAEGATAPPSPPPASPKRRLWGRGERRRSGRGMSTAGLVSLPVLPLAWFVGLQEHPVWMPIAYLAYFLVVIAIPGTMFWRRLTGGTGWFTVDVVLGTAFGLAVEALVYPVGMLFSMPFAALLMPALAVGMVRALPRTPRAPRPTPWWATAGVMVAVGATAAWFVRTGSQLIPLNGTAALRPNSDAPHNLAIAGELTHHFPPRLPYADGRWLTSHWAAYDHIASSHWITSIPLDVLTHRMIPFAWILLTVVGAAAVGMLLTGRAVAAPIAAGLTVAAGDLTSWPWAVSDRVFSDGPFSLGQLTNPPQAFSTVLLLPLIAVTALLLRRQPGRAPRAHIFRLLVAAAVLVAALALTKATTLPVYGAGLAAAWVYLTVRRGRVNLRGLVLGLGLAAAYVLSFFVVLRGTESSVRFAPARTFDLLGGKLPVIIAVVVVGWLMPAAGALLIRSRVRRDPLPVFLVFGLLAAVAAASLLYDEGGAQLFFVRTGFLYGVLLATWGLSSLERKQYWIAAVALLIGAAAIYWGRYRSPDSCTSTNCFGQGLAVALVIAAIGIGLFGLILRGSRRTWAVIAVAVLLGTTVSPTLASVRKFATPSLTEYESIAPGGIEAARFIRRNSGSNDRIATNVHCHKPSTTRCLAGSYWIAGYAERRVLVQGWAYRTRVDDTYPGKPQSDYWDQEKLRLNDEVFTNPTRELLETLRTKYGVQWLLLDDRVTQPPKNLDRLTDLRFELGNVRVYQLYPPPPANSPFPTPTPTPSFPTGTPSFPTGTPGFPSPTPSFPTFPSQQPSGTLPTQQPSSTFTPSQPFPSGTLPTGSASTPNFTPSQTSTTPGT